MRQQRVVTLRDRRVLVMGLGLHGGGVATTNWLLRQGAKVAVTDLRKRQVLLPSIKKIRGDGRVVFILGRHRIRDFRDAQLVVANPDVPASSPYLAAARQQGIPIENEASIFFSRVPCPVIGVTGSKGKSTTTTLLYLMLRADDRRTVMAGNIATSAMLDVLDRLTNRSRVILELSSWQLEGLDAVRKSPSLALVTNVLDDHLNRYASRRAYAAAKARIWKWQQPDDAVILNRDNPITRSWRKRPASRVLWFSLHPFADADGAFLRKGSLVVRLHGRERIIAHRDDSVLQGNHNLQNVLAAVLAASVLHVQPGTIRRVLQGFRGLASRFELVRTVRGIHFINDTTATAPVAAIAALRSCQLPVVLIAGGADKHLPYDEFAAMIRKRTKALVLLPGSATERLKTLLRPYRKPMVEVSSMGEAVRVARHFAKEGDAVLLSPGAASFGLFLHEFDRGKQFLRALQSVH